MPGGGGKKKGGKGGGGGKGGKGANSRIAPKIESMTWNADHTQVAIGVERDIIIFGAENEEKKSWTKLHELENAHNLDISGLDWNHKTNQIVSCSHDRNAYVWSLKDGQWKPEFVILHISRGALSVKWSPNGDSFAVTSGSKTVPVCYYDSEQNWWSPQLIISKKHKSSIVAVAWHPNSEIIATACTDKKCRVLSVVKDPTGEGAVGVLKNEDAKAGSVLAEFASSGWVHDCAFSQSGSLLCFVSHDSTVTICNFEQPSDDAPCLQTVVTCRCLPFTSCLFNNENQIIVAGHDFYPLRIDGKDDEWTVGAPVDKMEAKKKKETGAKAVFQNRDNLGQDSKVESLLTKHQAPIRELHLYKGTLTSAGSDGRLQFWKI